MPIGKVHLKKPKLSVYKIKIPIYTHWAEIFETQLNFRKLGKVIILLVHLTDSIFLSEIKFEVGLQFFFNFQENGKFAFMVVYSHQHRNPDEMM